jgi:alkylation response protein AidB-like acyl-CoA dehydrogenase
VAALAVDEGRKHRPESIAMTAERSGNGFKLTGQKRFVVQGASADVFVVAARAEEGLTLFTVEKEAAGLDVEGVRLADSSIGARVDFRGVEVDADAVLGEVGGGEAVLGRVLNAARAGAASEMVGVGAGAMAMTVDYLKQRKQFGKLIGEFQVLQHRAANLYSELEIARAAALKAQQLLDEGSAEAEAMVSVAKAKAGRVSTLAVQEGVQMHGGIGMTDEYDIGLYMKRDRVLNELFGDPNYHADKLARLKGY